MTVTDLIWDDFIGPLDESPIPKPRKPGIQCACGRFAKWAGDRHYYNGQFDCYSYTVRCSRCGDVTIECV